jgi:hypothetical protein
VTRVASLSATSAVSKTMHKGPKPLYPVQGKFDNISWAEVLRRTETVQKLFSLQELLSINFVITFILWADCLENVGASTFHNPMGLHGSHTGIPLIFLHFTLVKSVVKYLTNHYNSRKRTIQYFHSDFYCFVYIPTSTAIQGQLQNHHEYKSTATKTSTRTKQMKRKEKNDKSIKVI